MMRASAIVMSAPRQRCLGLSAADAVPGIAFLLLAVVILLRLDKGTDFSDEAYYALFVDDWLKGGIDSSSYLVVHETAALIVFPFAWLYLQVTGSTDGLFLFLRYLYLLGSVLASAAVIVLLRRLGLGVRSWSGGLLILAFIPFGLPAPSYNTIGLQALCVALAAYGCGVWAARRRTTDAWFAVSAFAWAVAAIAYPPLALAVCLMAALLLLLRKDRKLSAGRYVAMLVTAQAAGWVLVASVMSVSWVSMSWHYTLAIGAPGGLPAKLGRGVDLMAGNSWFAFLCVAAIGLGVVRRRLPFVVVVGATAGLVGMAFLQPAVFFVRSHDVVTLVALTGVGLIWDLRPSADSRARLVGILFTVSLGAGVATMIFATNLLFNFCLGAAFASALVVTVPDGGAGTRRDLMAAVAGLGVIGAVLSTSLTFFYGDSTAPGQVRERIPDGFFAGIFAGPDDVQLLEIVRDRVRPLVQDQPWVVYIGRNPGLVLGTSARLQMLSSYPFVAPASPQGLAETAAYYNAADPRPTTVFIYRDPLFDPVNPMGARFPEWYELSRIEKTPLGALEIYRRR